VNKRRNKRRDLISLVLSIAIIVLLNIIGSFVFGRFDLTSEKRYTLAPATVEMLENLQDIVYVKVYLEGEFPAGFKRLRNETREMLDEFRAYAGDNIEYEFINPSADPDKTKQDAMFKQLYEKGLNPTNLEVKSETGTSSQVIWPAALVSYRGREMPWQLLKQQMGISSEGQLNNSVQALEYELSNTIKKLGTAIKPRVAFITGHGELDSSSVASAWQGFSEYYEVEQVALNKQLNALTERDTASGTARNAYKAIIIAQPDTAFTEQDKFIIDQFVMNGGKVLWVLDPVYTDIDSLKRNGFTLGLENPLNLDDQLFKYGVRVNTNLALDMQCGFVPINKALVGQQPQWKLEPWLFIPLVMPASKHPIVNNLDLIKFEYASSIDTVGSKGIKKTVLLTTSKYTKMVTVPARIDLRMTTVKPDERQFKDPSQPLAVLLEGEFESVFKNRPEIKSFTEAKSIVYKEKSAPNRMIVISDGDVIRNEVQRASGQAMELGYDMYSRQMYANKTFILNCMNYLTDDSGLLSVRAREVKLRLLDKKKIKTQETKWKVLNTAVPIIIVIVFGIIQFFVRKKKYAS
jgi:ABC-2 type transport system permease protein